MTQAPTNPQAAQVARLYASVPAVVTIFGRPGFGKTTDTLYSFPRALFIARRGALKPVAHVVGYAPADVIEADDIDDVVEILAKHTAGGKSKSFDAVVVDDWSMAVEAQVAKWEKRYPDGRMLYKAVQRQAVSVITSCRSLACHTVFNTGLKEPGVRDGVTLVGGPKLPGQLIETFTSWCDLVLRADAQPVRKPWPVCYRVGQRPPNQGWITKDRHGVCPDEAPMNLGEILRAAGYTIQRPLGLEWMEGVVAEYATAILQGQPDTTALGALARTARQQGCPDWQTIWMLRDVRDRVEIAKWQTNRITREFGISF